MKVVDFSGKEHKFNLKKLCKEAPSPSGLHLQAREIIRKTLPYCQIYEEVQLVGTKLIADFFIPDLKIVIEVHGEQHYKFVKRFHKNMAGFRASQKRDKVKQDWCELNDIIYIELPFDKIPNWAKIIKAYL